MLMVRGSVLVLSLNTLLSGRPGQTVLLEEGRSSFFDFVSQTFRSVLHGKLTDGQATTL